MTKSTLAEKLSSDQKDAMKAKDTFRLSVIRLLRAEIQNGVIEKKAPLDHNEELAILIREVKRRKDALEDFERSGRQNLIDDLKQEIEILSEYLPEQLSDQELVKMVKDAIAESGAESKREMGKVMSLLMPRVKGRADGGKVRQLVENNLE